MVGMGCFWAPNASSGKRPAKAFRGPKGGGERLHEAVEFGLGVVDMHRGAMTFTRPRPLRSRREENWVETLTLIAWARNGIAQGDMVGAATAKVTTAPFTLPRSVRVIPFKVDSRARRPSANRRSRAQIASTPSSLAWSAATFRPMTPAK